MKPFGFETDNIKKKANKAEKIMAKKLGGIPQPLSGAISGYKGDIKTKKHLFDLKQTEAKSFRVTLKDLDKIEKEANGLGKIPILLVDFEKYKNRKFVVLNLNDWEDLINENC